MTRNKETKLNLEVKLRPRLLIFAIFLVIFISSVTYTANVLAAPPEPTPQPSVELKGLVDPPEYIEAVVDTVDDPEIKTDVFAMEEDNE